MAHEESKKLRYPTLRKKKRKKIKIPANIIVQPRYECPTTHIPYAGMCPVVACPANVSHLNRTSGCVFNFLNGKRELSAVELSYTFNTDIKTTKKKIAEGEEAIQFALLLYKLLIKARETTTTKHFCNKCGILRTSFGDCLNQVQCQDRVNKLTPYLTRYPFNLPELNINKKDIFILLHHRTTINKYLKVFDKPNRRIRFAQLLNLTSPELNDLRELRTIV